MKPPTTPTPYPARRPKKPWYARWWATTVWVFLGLGLIGSFLPEEGPTEQTAGDTSATAIAEPKDEAGGSPANDETDSAGEEAGSTESEKADDGKKQKNEPKPAPKRSKNPEPTPTPTPKPSPTADPNKHTAVVSRVIDGDTVELSNGQSVRVLGIDTPERGECHFETASRRMARLVEGRTVSLTRSDEDTDRYGRLLRYLDIGDIDPGLRLIKEGLAIARYDSRDGYGYHPREPRYIAADNAAPQRTCAPPPAPEPEPETEPQQPAGNCEPGYDPCVPAYPPDVNCADVDGPVQVSGPDPHGLDRDRDGIACE